jgi:hypothetical protein
MHFVTVNQWTEVTAHCFKSAGISFVKPKSQAIAKRNQNRKIEVLRKTTSPRRQ